MWMPKGAVWLEGGYGTYYQGLLSKRTDEEGTKHNQDQQPLNCPSSRTGWQDIVKPSKQINTYASLYHKASKNIKIRIKLDCLKNKKHLDSYPPLSKQGNTYALVHEENTKIA
jgi:hypothetical protein